MVAPEFNQLTKENKRRPFSVDKTHVYLLARNLYQYLTKKSLQELSTMDKKGGLKFDDPIFDTELGAKYRSLIERCCTKIPEDRPSLEDWRIELYTLKHGNGKKALIGLKQESYALLKKFLPFAIGIGDSLIHDHMTDCNIAIDKAESLSDLLEINDNIYRELAQLKQDIITPRIKAIIAHHREHAKWYNGRAEKADKIEQALLKVPPLERANIAFSQSPKAIEVLNAMAEHRHFFRSAKAHLRKDGQLSLSSAASSFRLFNKHVTHIPDKDTNTHGEDTSTKPTKR